MKSNIFIPEKINVGFRERSDTYTQKLAYIIYFDEKGILRKETSWNSWRDEKIDPQIHNNEPTSGFVLNKKAGGYSTGWNHRQTYVRVYDPRGFEFEISVPNLLYILENTNSIKGKGLEGEFVYGWDGKELVLIPTESPDYVEITNFNKLVHNQVKLKGKDLKLGGTYLTKDNEEWIYLGRFDKWDTDYDNKYVDEKGYTIYPDIVKGKAYFFKHPSKYGDGITTVKSLSKFIGVVSEECIENYAELMDMVERNTYYSPIDNSKDEYLPYTFEEFEQKFEKTWWEVSFYLENHDKKVVYLNKRQDVSEGIYENIKEEYEENVGWRGMVKRTRTVKMPFNSVKEVYDKYQPHYLNKYLANGKLYSEGK